LPGPSHPPQWASDGEEPAPHFSIRSDVSLITEIEILNVFENRLNFFAIFGILFIYNNFYTKRGS